MAELQKRAYISDLHVLYTPDKWMCCIYDNMYSVVSLPDYLIMSYKYAFRAAIFHLFALCDDDVNV